MKQQHTIGLSTAKECMHMYCTNQAYLGLLLLGSITHMLQSSVGDWTSFTTYCWRITSWQTSFQTPSCKWLLSSTHDWNCWRL